MDRINSLIRTPPFFLFFLLLLLKCTLQQQQPLSSSIERRALIQLRASLGLRAGDWPIKADPCLNWRGISCVNGTVVGINIAGFRRTRVGSQNPRFAVDSLANLTRLESFNASNFALPGQIPGLFGNSVGGLRVLDLSFCLVGGVIPSSLGNLTQLGILNLSHNGISEAIPSSLGQLLNLSILDLSWNKLSGSVPSSFASLRNLAVLDISVNLLSGSIPPVIGNLSILKKLNFARNNLTGSVPAQLGDLSSLVDLDLSTNLLVSSLPLDLNGMKNIQRIVLRSNRLSGELPGDLFGGLTKLELLDLSLNNFSGAIPDTLWFMSSLTFVNASGNNFTGTLPGSLATVNAIAAQFNLSNNKYYGVLTSVIQRFSLIDLSSNYFQGQVPAYAKRNGSVTLNCLQDVTSQRNLEQCTSFYASKGLTFDNFGQPNAGDPGLAPAPTGRKSHKRTIILAAILGALGLLLILLLLGLLFICTRRRKGITTQRGIGAGPIPTPATPPCPTVALNFASLGEAFTYQLLLQATADFSDANLIKHGHSGDFFRGLLEGGTRVVVKRVDLTTIRREAYLHELDFFSKVSHTRLVPLLGHCLENENEKYLVYKYMPNGDLSSSLYRKVNVNDDGLQSLDWITRLKIAIGAAEGLCYLHHECYPPFVHRDVQASSILLDDKFEVRLGSVSEICAQEGDARQSMITKFLRMPQNSEQGSSGSQTSTCAYDVYCFGKVLLELVTGKMGISASNEVSVKEWLDQTIQYIHIYDKELINKIVDPSLIVHEDLLEEVWAMAIVARSCLNPAPSRRPLMKYILKALENPLRVVREENVGSDRLSGSSSRNSWNTGVFGSWTQSSSDVGPNGPTVVASSTSRTEGTGSMKRSGTSGSQGSSGPTNGGGDENMASQKRQSRDIFPEPLVEQDIERQGEE